MDVVSGSEARKDLRAGEQDRLGQAATKVQRRVRGGHHLPVYICTDSMDTTLGSGVKRPGQQSSARSEGTYGRKPHCRSFHCTDDGLRLSTLYSLPAVPTSLSSPCSSRLTHPQCNVLVSFQLETPFTSRLEGEDNLLKVVVSHSGEEGKGRGGGLWDEGTLSTTEDKPVERS